MRSARLVVISLVAALWLVGSPTVGAAAEEPGGPQLKHQKGVPFVSGGVGDEDQDALRRLSSNFNFELTLATPSGKLMGPAVVKISDDKGAVVIGTETEGPLLLAELPPGRYTIEVVADGQPRTATVTVPAHGREQLSLTWPDQREPIEAGDAPRGDAPRTMP